jgi:ribonuclease HI
MWDKNDLRFYFCDKLEINNNSNIVQNSSIKSGSSGSFDIFTDGSCFNNGSKHLKHYGGIGVYFSDNSITNISESLESNEKQTNNTAELKACIRAIEVASTLDLKNRIVIYSDSTYVINCITKWYKNWVKNGWQKYNYTNKKKMPVKNKKLIIDLYKLCNEYSIELRHCKAHGNMPIDKKSKEYYLWNGNRMADILARNGSKNINNLK